MSAAVFMRLFAPGWSRSRVERENARRRSRGEVSLSPEVYLSPERLPVEGHVGSAALHLARALDAAFAPDPGLARARSAAFDALVEGSVSVSYSGMSRRLSDEWLSASRRRAARLRLEVHRSDRMARGVAARVPAVRAWSDYQAAVAAGVPAVDLARLLARYEAVSAKLSRRLDPVEVSPDAEVEGEGHEDAPEVDPSPAFEPVEVAAPAVPAFPRPVPVGWRPARCAVCGALPVGSCGRPSMRKGRLTLRSDCMIARLQRTCR